MMQKGEASTKLTIRKKLQQRETGGNSKYPTASSLEDKLKT
jgi:hypothetical protein